MSRYIFAFMVFVTVFVGWSSWASRGLPELFSSIGINTMPPLVTATFGDQSAKDFKRKLWEAEHTAQSDKNPNLDKIRLEALQAGTAYSMSPCDKTMKSNLIEAVTAYTRAWQNRMDCPRPLDMLVFCGDQKVREVAATFSTPLDLRVQAALMAAFEQKGIVKSDFPESVRFDLLKFAGPGLWVNESPLCMPRLRGSAQRGAR
jgi:hypothetical protein